jgi:hypothetical protein
MGLKKRNLIQQEIYHMGYANFVYRGKSHAVMYVQDRTLNSEWKIIY